MPRLLVMVTLTMTMTLPAGAGPSRLFDFASSSAAAEWQAVNDGVMGGVSDGKFRITSERTLEFFGTLSLENNGGFTSVRSVPRSLGLMHGDTLIARVRGDGREYQLNLYTPVRTRAFSYRSSFNTVRDQWIDVRVPLDRFVATSFGQPIRGVGPIDPSRVTSLGFLLSDKAPGPFRLEVASIEVVRDAPPSSTPHAENRP